MKRLILSLAALAVTAGSFVTTVEAGSFSQNVWKARHRVDQPYDDENFYRYDRRQDRRKSRDPVVRALRKSDRVLLGNFFDGRRYRSANRWFSTHQLRYMGRSDCGRFYRVRFRGRTYNATAKRYKDDWCLYLGSAPTGPGYRYELILR